jgi:hypothetical protein
MLNKLILKIKKYYLIDKLENSYYSNRELKTEDFLELARVKNQLKIKNYFYIKFDNKEIFRIRFFKSLELSIHRISWRDFVKSKSQN